MKALKALLAPAIAPNAVPVVIGMATASPAVASTVVPCSSPSTSDYLASSATTDRYSVVPGGNFVPWGSDPWQGCGGAHAASGGEPWKVTGANPQYSAYIQPGGVRPR
jgi:hypothetical protein